MAYYVSEEGTPIRKLYVCPLPYEVTRGELNRIFSRYGLIQTCWIRRNNQHSMELGFPTYAFITYQNPTSAYNAFKAPCVEKMLRGRVLTVFTADRWNQPTQDERTGRVIYKPTQHRVVDPSRIGESYELYEVAADKWNAQAANPQVNIEETVMREESSCLFMQVLNKDCINHVLSYVPIRQLIGTEQVSKSWQRMVQEYLNRLLKFHTSWWQQKPFLMSTAELRFVLSRVGGQLRQLHVDHVANDDPINERSLKYISRFCRKLEEIKIYSMHTKIWNPLGKHCKNLIKFTFINCLQLKDVDLSHLIKYINLESLTVVNNPYVTGRIINPPKPPKLKTLVFDSCMSLQGKLLKTTICSYPLLTTLKLVACPIEIWVIINILKKLPKLEELSLTQLQIPKSKSLQVVPFGETIATLKNLKRLNLCDNMYVTDVMLKLVGQCCEELEKLNITNCNGKLQSLYRGVGDAGMAAISRSCSYLRELNVSQLHSLTDAGVRSLAALPQLEVLCARYLPNVTSAAFAQCLKQCSWLVFVDVTGCKQVTDDLIGAAMNLVKARRRPIILRLVGTAVTVLSKRPNCDLLVIYVKDARNPNAELKMDFVRSVPQPLY